MKPPLDPLPPELLARRYDRLAPLCGLFSPLHGPTAREVVLRRAALRDGESFLEAGVGTGPSFVPLARANVTGSSQGIDLSPGMLRRCQRRLVQARADHAGVRLQQADVRALPFPDATFDLVLGCYLMGGLSEPDQDRALDELHRVLKLGGRILLVHTTSGGLRLHELAARWHRLARPVELAPRLTTRFRDVSRVVYRDWGLASELLRGVKL